LAVEITGNPKAVMRYVNYEEEIVIRYGIKLEGWTYENFKNPSELSSSLPPLRALYDAIDKGMCRFVKLTATEKKKFEQDFNAKVQTGEVTLRKRKIRKDAGKKKAKRRRTDLKGKVANDNESSSESEEDEEEGVPGGFKSTEFVNDDE
jgi:hypothetical protein